MLERYSSRRRGEDAWTSSRPGPVRARHVRASAVRPCEGLGYVQSYASLVRQVYCGVQPFTTKVSRREGKGRYRGRQSSLGFSLLQTPAEPLCSVAWETLLQLNSWIAND
jgi:hypothetical protein